MTQYALVLTTVSSREEAKTIAQVLVRDKLAACVQIVAANSVFSWKGAVEEATEWLLTAKIRADAYAIVEAAILGLHSYETPEIVATPIIDGFQPYLDWIAASTAR